MTLSVWAKPCHPQRELCWDDWECGSASNAMGILLHQASCPSGVIASRTTATLSSTRTVPVGTWSGVTSISCWRWRPRMSASPCTEAHEFSRACSSPIAGASRPPLTIVSRTSNVSFWSPLPDGVRPRQQYLAERGSDTTSLWVW
jgi:hypothetical protein